MKTEKPPFHFFIGDRLLILSFAVFDIFLILLAYHHFQNIRSSPSEVILSRTNEEEENAIDELKHIATTGSWEAFENARSERVGHYLQYHLRPKPGNALYFYPETLPAQSLEREFVFGEIVPIIETIRTASTQNKLNEASQAFNQLKSRVENFELGASGNPNDLSEEAQHFLELYSNFIKK